MVFSFGSKSSERLIFQSFPLESKSEELELECPKFYLTNQMPSQHRFKHKTRLALNQWFKF